MTFSCSVDLKLFIIDDKLIKIFFLLADHAEEDVFVIINLNHVRKFKADENEVCQNANHNLIITNEMQKQNALFVQTKLNNINNDEIMNQAQIIKTISFTIEEKIERN